MYSIARRVVQPVAGAATRPARLAVALRYASSSTMHDNDPEVLDREKRRNLAGTQHETSTPHKEHAPGWNEHLASESEAHIKADKSGVQVEELVKTTVEYVSRRHPKDSLDQSYNLKDEIEGPLKGAQSSENSRPDAEAGGHKFHGQETMTGSEEAVKADRH